MLLVILGAGASFDSAPAIPPAVTVPDEYLCRPPLADSLFADRPLFQNTMLRFRECLAVIPMLRHRRDGVQVEEILEKLQAEAPEYPARLRQLAAIRYYLQGALDELVKEWNKACGQITAYRTLIDQTARWRHRYESCAIVTFNYDTLIDDAMSVVGLTFGAVDDYIKNNSFRLFKVHGSVNWARQVNGEVFATGADQLIAAAENLSVSDRFQIAEDLPSVVARDGNANLMPAIAIPVQLKTSFECPEHHLTLLRELLPRVTRVLIVGWRAMDRHFVEMLARHVPSGLHWMVVAGQVTAGKEIEDRLSPTISGKWSLAPIGFSRFITHGLSDEFLSA